jgi:1,4-alpha-glucan branching enzyme
MKSFFILLVSLLFANQIFAQDSINVTFRYTPTGSIVRAFVPGEFNNWGPNSSGRISPTAPSLMTNEDGTWYKSIRLRIGGGSAVINNEHVYQYKIHEHLNSDGSSYNWLPDPLNPNQNASDNYNSYFAVKHPLIFQIEPVSNQVIRNDQLPITATVAAKSNDSIDVTQSSVVVNGTLAGYFEGYYNREKQLLELPSLSEFGVSLQHGNNWIKIIAVTKSGITRADSVQVSYLGAPEIIDEPVPAGIVDGINYSANPLEATLCLFAPYKKFVYVIGDFNNWQVSSNYLMKRDSTSADSIRWWLKISSLVPQKEYAFQYFVDDEIRIADPYTEKVLDPWDDQYISSSTYPDLMEYPAGKTEEIVSVLQTNQPEFEWQNADFARPEGKKLVIYELLVRDFVANHDYKTLTDTLDYLKNLGITAIELMPVTEFEGNDSWGYNPSFYFAPDKYYGPATDLKRFIDACHGRGIAVIMDMVLNHSYGQSPFVRLYNEGDYGQPLPENPWYNVTAPHEFSWGYDFNHESKATQALVDRINRFWLEEYDVDGFRFDFTKGFTNKSGSGWEYDASRVAIIKRMLDQMWAVSPGAYAILEHWTTNSEEKDLANYGAMLWGHANSSDAEWGYYEAAMGYHDNGKSDFSWGFYKTRGWTKPNLVTYMESHDEERLMYKNLTYGNSYGDYNIKDLPTALNRMKMAAAFFLTLPGPKMIWQFGELGYDYSIDYNGRVGKKPIRWDYLNDSNRKNLYKTFSWLLKLRNENEAFTSENTIVNMSVSGAGKRMNISHSALNTTIIGNFGVQELSVNPNFQHSGDWYNFFDGETLNVVSNIDPITLAPGEFYIYTDKKLETPDEDIISDVSVDFVAPPVAFELYQNFPNPFNPSTTIEYQITEPGNIRLEIFNVLGQKIVTLLNEKQNPGRYNVKWNGTNFQGNQVPSGVYIYRLSNAEGVKSRKLVLMK